MVDPTIKLRIKTKKLMDKRRRYPRETYNSIVERLLERAPLEKIEKPKDALIEDESNKETQKKVIGDNEEELKDG